ncbi:MAG: DUF4390 domain-containing protein [Mariprofundus sp.]|nr:DUF4390 domain-containing protein [Mariprofundus sp.]
MMLTSLLFSSVSLAADSNDSLQVRMDEAVVYCSVQLQKAAKDRFLAPMQNGLAVTVVWNIQVSKQREYWLDERVADISVERRVEPDLLTHSWLLVNVSNGISLRIHDIRLVMDFLTHLKQFPMLDRSLLLADTTYRANVDVNIHIGEQNDAWWAELWPSSVASMQQSFTLP